LIVKHKYFLQQFRVNIDSFGGCWTWHLWGRQSVASSKSWANEWEWANSDFW